MANNAEEDALSPESTSERLAGVNNITIPSSWNEVFKSPFFFKQLLLIH